jgi:beta-glucosidase
VLKAGPGSFPVGLTLSMTDYQAVPPDDAAAVAERDGARRMMEDRYLDLVAAMSDDFLGVQVYSRGRFGPAGMLGPEPGIPVLPMGYEYYPESLAHCLRRAWEVTGGRVPLDVTENGIGTDDDDQRIAYVRAALEGVLGCLDDGIPVAGYTYWSLMDNFEWAFGYRPRFGIVAVDRATQRRTVKASGEWLGRVARSGSLTGA